MNDAKPKRISKGLLRILGRAITVDGERFVRLSDFLRAVKLGKRELRRISRLNRIDIPKDELISETSVGYLHRAVNAERTAKRAKQKRKRYSPFFFSPVKTKDITTGQGFDHWLYEWRRKGKSRRKRTEDDRSLQQFIRYCDQLHRDLMADNRDLSEYYDDFVWPDEMGEVVT